MYIYPTSLVGGGQASTRNMATYWDTPTYDTWILVSGQIGIDINVSPGTSAYARGATVNISGIFYMDNGSVIPDKNVTVVFFNSSNATMDTVNVTTNSSGGFWRNYTLAPDTPYGLWRVNVTGWYDGTTYAVQNTSFNVSDVPPYVHSLSVSPSLGANGSTINVSDSTGSLC